MREDSCHRSRLVVATDLGERWLARLEDDHVAEVRVAPLGDDSLGGAIFKGRVVRSASGMNAVFVDVGLARDLLLVAPTTRGEVTPLPRVGQGVLVQLVREAAAGKGHRATVEISLAGTLAILAPGGRHRGISRRLDAAERERLRAVLEEVAPAEHGVILRTAAGGASREEIAEALQHLVEKWERLGRRAESLGCPALVEPGEDRVLRFVRDRLAGGEMEIIADDEDALATIKAFLASEPVGKAPVLRLHEGPVPAVEAFGLDRALAHCLESQAELPGGGRLVIQRTEAMVTVDVNSGHDMDQGDLEQTALRTNLEAARAAAREIVLRNLAGLIVIDFIDMRLAASRHAVSQALAEALAADRARHRLLPLTEFCLGQITRQRRGPSVTEAFTLPCTSCLAGRLPAPAYRARALLREARREVRERGRGPVKLHADREVLDHARRIAAAWGPSSGLPESALNWSD
ncbi:MAG: ribonuclease E/G [Acidobacteriota bacterium]|nr:ribonuclease E/G [Acidobacteriota bacterium]